jgi:hypothetical protein
MHIDVRIPRAQDALERRIADMLLTNSVAGMARSYNDLSLSKCHSSLVCQYLSVTRLTFSADRVSSTLFANESVLE